MRTVSGLNSARIASYDACPPLSNVTLVENMRVHLGTLINGAVETSPGHALQMKTLSGFEV